MRLDGVDQAVVIAREDRPGDKRLVGYITGTVDPADVRARLGERLPAYMVPAAVVALEALPLTVNGKLDTRALPAPEYVDGDRYRAPATAIEEILAGIYAQVLGVDRVGVDDSFFELGGDSILSMQVVARARAAGVLCRPRDVFVEQTVAKLARVAGVTDGVGGPVDEGIGPVAQTPIMCWLHDMDGPVDQFNQTIVVQAPDGVDEADAVLVVQALLDRHAMLRCRVEDDGAGGWALRVPEVGSVDARECVQAVDALSDEAVVSAVSRLNPAAGMMVQRAVVESDGRVGVDRAPPGRRRGVVANPVGRPQYCVGAASQRPADSAARAGDVVRPVGVAACRARAPPGCGGPGSGVAAGGGDSGAVAGRAAGGGHVRLGRAPVGAVGCRDHPDASR